MPLGSCFMEQGHNGLQIRNQLSAHTSEQTVRRAPQQRLCVQRTAHQLWLIEAITRIIANRVRYLGHTKKLN